MKKIIKKIGFIILLCIVYFLGKSELIFYPNVTERFITNIIVSIALVYFLCQEYIRIINHDIKIWLYKTDKNQKINDTTEVFNGLIKLLSICIVFLFTKLFSVIKLERLKLLFLLLGLTILFPIVYTIEHKYK